MYFSMILLYLTPQPPIPSATATSTTSSRPQTAPTTSLVLPTSDVVIQRLTSRTPQALLISLWMRCRWTIRRRTQMTTSASSPPNATDYVEEVFGPAPGISTPTVAPRAVEVITEHFAAGTGLSDEIVKLNDNGTVDNIYDGTGIAGTTTGVYKRK